MKPNEQVLVFPENKIKEQYPYIRKNGGIVTDKFFINDCLSIINNDTFYMDRAEAEQNSSFKQVIPYTLLWKDLDLFRYQRTKKGGENRLHDLWSFGVGGHINPCDGFSSEKYKEAQYRELFEEVSFKVGPDDTISNTVEAVIYDESNEVGKVHFGVVHYMKISPNVKLEMKDEALSNGEFVYIEDLRVGDVKYENWSNLILNGLLS